MVNVFNNMNNGMALQRKKYPVLTTKLFLNSLIVYEDNYMFVLSSG